MNKPNLFNWATSELSQDAFICWLLSWANHDEEKPLQEIAIQLINTLTKNSLQEIQSVQIVRQRYKIDILCIVNNEYAILIEDKTNTHNHSNQLVNYYNKLSNDFPKEKIFPIYLKTGDQSSYHDVLQKGYDLFLRKDFLTLLESGISSGISNQIFIDYYHYLKRIDDSVESYKTLPVKEWHFDSWKGFFMTLQTQLKEGDWNYVPQKNGGFMGFWWAWKTLSHDGTNYNVYLQLEETKFCFKLTCEHLEKSREIRDSYRKKLYIKANESQIAVRQNGRIGKWMTVAALSQPYIQTDSNGFLDLESTVRILKSIQNMTNTI